MESISQNKCCFSAFTEDKREFKIEIYIENEKLYIYNQNNYRNYSNEYICEVTIDQLKQFLIFSEYNEINNDIINDFNEIIGVCMSLNNFPKIEEETNLIKLNIPIKIGKIKNLIFQLNEKEKEKYKIISEINNKMLELKNENIKLKTQIKEYLNRIEEEEQYRLQFNKSDILHFEDMNLINNFFDDKLEFSLLYSSQQANSEDIQTLHTNVNGKNQNIIFIQTENDKRIGGYTSISWGKISGYYNDPYAFIFSLDSKKKYTLNYKKDIHAINYDEKNGPTFGDGHSIFISNNFKSSNENYCNKDTTYNLENELNLLGESGKTQFKIKFIEIYGIEYKIPKDENEKKIFLKNKFKNKNFEKFNENQKYIEEIIDILSEIKELEEIKKLLIDDEYFYVKFDENIKKKIQEEEERKKKEEEERKKKEEEERLAEEERKKKEEENKDKEIKQEEKPKEEEQPKEG